MIQVGILVFGVLSLVMALLTFYGASAGSFVVSIKQSDYKNGIGLSESPGVDGVSPRVYAKAMERARDMMFSDLPLEEIWATDGDYPDTRHEYIAYSFYLTNIGEQTVNVTLKIDITGESSNLGGAIRIILIDENGVWMYQRPDDKVFDYPYLIDTKENFNVVEFNGNSVVGDKVIEALEPGKSTRYSIIVYIEGNDPDCVDEIQDGGSLQLKMEFSIIREK
jgi:hypothetical protein